MNRFYFKLCYIYILFLIKLNVSLADDNSNINHNSNINNKNNNNNINNNNNNNNEKTQFKVESIETPEVCELKTENGNHITLHYTGYFPGGQKFDSSYDRDSPFTFQLGMGQVIKGWDQGLKGMCVGEKRKLIIPPELGYGDRGAGNIIPAGAVLLYDVELLHINTENVTTNVFKEIDSDKDQMLSREEVSEYLRSQMGNAENGADINEMLMNNDKLVEEIFQHEDTDKNGFISHEEFSGPKHDEL